MVFPGRFDVESEEEAYLTPELAAAHGVPEFLDPSQRESIGSREEVLSR